MTIYFVQAIKKIFQTPVKKNPSNLTKFRMNYIDDWFTKCFDEDDKDLILWIRWTPRDPEETQQEFTLA